MRLPQPFNTAVWPKALRPAAQALWDWHEHLAHREARAFEAADRHAFLDAECAQVEEGAELRVVPAPVAEAAYAVCRTHSLPTALLAEQVRAAVSLSAPLRFESYAELQGFVQQWAGSHARLLARLAGYTGGWQVRYVDVLARAFFLTGRLVYLPDDLARDHLFIPLDELRQAEVTVEQLRAGTVDEALRRLLWKQAVRIRDAFAQGQNLGNDMPRGHARVFKRWWLGGLEVVNQIERRGYDVWSQPLTLSPVHRFRVRMQALVGKTSFR